MVERGQMMRILEEQDFQTTGCTSNECAVSVGQLLGVTAMVAGNIRMAQAHQRVGNPLQAILFATTALVFWSADIFYGLK